MKSKCAFLETLGNNIGLHIHLNQCRVRKSKNFPDSKIYHAKTFRIKRVNRDTFAFATKVRKTREFHVFLANEHNVKLDGVWIIWWLSGSSGKFLYYPDSFLIVQTVSILSGQSLECPESFYIIRTVSGLSGQFLDYPDSLWIVQTASRLAGKFIDYPNSFWIVQTVSRLSGQSLDCSESC